MSRIWPFIWLLAAAGGFTLMVFAYRDAKDKSGDDSNQHILYVAETPKAKAEKGLPVAVCFLPPDENVKLLSNSIFGKDPTQARSFLRNHQNKVILLPDFEQQFTKDMLESGRLPARGSNEVLAEFSTSLPDRITIGDQSLLVVGALKKTNSMMQDAYYAADDLAIRDMIDLGGELLLEGSLFSLSDLDNVKDLKKLFPRAKFTAIVGSPRMERGAYYNYVGGIMLFLLGGFAFLIQCYIFAAGRITNAWLGPPLAEIAGHWKLFTLLHAVFLVCYFAGLMLIYELPLVQDILLASVRGELQNESSLLGTAGKAYGSGSIPLAALTTLGINFFAGSILVITLPSFLVPGIGLFMLLLRATVWGIVLSPALMVLAGTMIFHSGTLLLEGEGYILAAFFAILVPIYLFSPSAGEKLGTRYKRALMINIKGNIVVFIVLAIAATYEAIEVILQMKG